MKKILSVILAAALTLGGLGVNKVGAYEKYSTAEIYNQAIRENGKVDTVYCVGLQRDIYDSDGARAYTLYDYTSSSPNKNIPSYGYIDKNGNTQYIQSSWCSVSVNVQYIVVQYQAVTVSKFTGQKTLGINDDGLWHKRRLATVDGTNFWICGKTVDGVMDMTSSTQFNGIPVIDNPHNAGEYMYWGTSLKRIYKSLREIAADEHLSVNKQTSDATYTYVLNEDFTAKIEKKYGQYASSTHYYSLSTISNPAYNPSNFNKNNLVYTDLGGWTSGSYTASGKPWFVRYNNWGDYYF